MNSFLLRFEAVESQIASYSCPRGTPGRVHALRLRRCFQHSRFQQAPASKAQQSSSSAEPRNETDADSVGFHHREARRGAIRRVVQSRFRLPEQGGNHRESRSSKPFDIWGWHMVPGGRSTLPDVGEQDVLPVPFPDGVQVCSSPNTDELYRALRVGYPHNVLKALINMVRFDGLNHYSQVLRNVPPNTFSEILRCFDAYYFTHRYSLYQQELSENTAASMGLPPVSSSGGHRFHAIFLSQIHGIIKARQQDRPISISDYRYLLKCARAAGNIRIVQDVWKAMTAVSLSGHSVSVKPDGLCYNHYLAVIAWSDLESPYLRHRLRVIPDNVVPRSWSTPPYSLQGHRVGPNNGVKLHMAQIFRQMVQAGVSPDEETFCLMIIGFAREGDMLNVASTLKRVWGIDVDALLSIDESEMQPVKQYALDSPLYPSFNLLHTISHAYGINNDISTALRVVDYVSRQYKIKVPTPVWSELLQWTFVLSRKRSGRPEDNGMSMGQLPKDAVVNLWRTMTSPPYSIEPTMDMYDKLIMSLLSLQRFGEVEEVMVEARRLHLSHVRRMSKRNIILLSTLEPSHPVSEKQMRDFQLARLRVMRNRKYLNKWVRLLISKASNSLRYEVRWNTQSLPMLLERWRRFLPSRRTRYQTATGWVRFGRGAFADRNYGAKQETGRVGFKARAKGFRRADRRMMLRLKNRMSGSEAEVEEEGIADSDGYR